MRKSTTMKRWLLALSLGLATLLGAAHAQDTVTYVYTDAQGTPLAETNAAGVITASYDYTPYGSAVTAGGMAGSPTGPGYTGHVNDPETGLVYMQARYYDPSVGRFLSVDPVTPTPGNAFNFNRFTYANNNPILNVDPNGRNTQSPLFQLNWFNKVVNKAVDENITQPMAAMPSRQEAANRMDQANLVTTGITVATSEIPVVGEVAGAADGATALTAFALDPTKARGLNVLTLGAFALLKAEVKTAKMADETEKHVEKAFVRAEQAKGTGELVKAAQESHEKAEKAEPMVNAHPMVHDAEH